MVTPAGTGTVQLGKNNAVIQLKMTHVRAILMPSLACGSSRASPSEREETSRGRRRRQLAGVRRHVQACNAGGPGAKKNILAALPPCCRWAGQPQWFPPDWWVSRQMGTRVVLGAGRLPTYTRLTARSSAAVCRAVAIALASGTWAYPGPAEHRAGSGLPSALVASLAVALDTGRGGGFVAGRDVPTGLPPMPACSSGTRSSLVHSTASGVYTQNIEL